MSPSRLTFLLAMTFHLLCTAAAAGQERVSKTFTFRQSVVWMSEGKQTAASNVQRVTLTWWSPIFGLDVTVYGEALGANVEGIGQVFLALGNYDGPPIAAVCGVASPDLTTAKQARRWFAKLEAAFQSKCEGPVEAAPIVVTFEDFEDPETAAAFAAGALPPGLQLVSYEIVPTGEEPTFGTVPLVGWLDDNRLRAVDIWNGSLFTGSLSLSEATFVRHSAP